ncbi:PAS domain S-box protein, partial [Thermodesulfobacteriota bacterium]
AIRLRFEKDHLIDSLSEEKAKVEQFNLYLKEEIAEHTETEEALEQEKKRFRTIFENAPFGIVLIGPDGTYDHVNPKFTEIFGYEISEVPNGARWFEATFPDPVQRRKVKKEWKDDLSRAEPGELRPRTHEVVCKDGTKKTVHFRPVQMASGDHLTTCEDVTEKKLTEQALIQSERRYRTLYQDTPAMLQSIDNAGRLLSVSNEWLRVLGFEREEVLGRPSTEFLTEQSRRRAHDQVLPRLFRTGHCREVPYQLTKKNGDVIDVLFSATAECDDEGEVERCLAVLVDVTARKRAEKALRESETRFRQLAENIQDVFWLTHPDKPRQLSYVSPAYEKVWGIRRDSINNNDSRWMKSVHKEDRERVKRAYQEFIQGSADYNLEYRILKPDGNQRWIWDRGFPIKNRKGRMLRVAGLAQDITQRKSDQERQRELVEEIKHFAYIVSHDLREPLINVRGFSDELNQAIEVIRPAVQRLLDKLPEDEKSEIADAIEEDVPEALHYIKTSISHMDRLVESVLRLSRLERMELCFEPLDMNGLVNQVLDSLAYQIGRNGTKLEIQDLPEIVADRVSMEQILGNLLGNAVKFTDPNRLQEIHVSGRRFPDEAAFVIRDNGCGIDQAHLTQVFQVFERVGKDDVPGDGMGLAYVRALVRRHDGGIWCESTPGHGSAFTFTISNHLRLGKG